MANMKSKTTRKVFVRTPGGKAKVMLKPKSGKQARCPVTNQKLAGTPKARPRKLKGSSRSVKKPSRLFGGMLSSWAARREIIRRVRK
ncbi:MAG: hypothetical protein ACOCWQ_03515 [Nanoarchaeota archaeon]